MSLTIGAVKRENTNVMDMLAADQGKNQKEAVQEIFSQLVKNKKAEYIAKIQNGSSEQSFQIGAGSYTPTEWERLLKGFDAAEVKLRESTEEATREAQEIEERKVFDEDNESEEESVEMLFSEFTTAIYPSGDKDIPDDVYYTFYNEEGIYCRKQGHSEFEWQIPFEDQSQYEEVMSYLQGFAMQDNLRFACHKNFWQDFLGGQVNMEQFNNFLDTRVVDGVPNYLNVYETGVNIDTESAQYAKYMNLPDFVKNMCYTSEEAFETFFKHRKVDGNGQPGHEVIDMNDLGQYYAKQPNEIGQRNHYYNGRWYSMLELVTVWNRELAELFGQGTQEKMG